MIEGILLENALEETLKRADRITDTKTVRVEEANGFCLAEDIYAELDNPPFPRSPVDGYAVRSEDPGSGQGKSCGSEGGRLHLCRR